MNIQALLSEGPPSEDGKAVPVSKRVANELRLMIVRGEFSPGDWVRKQAVADRFGVSVQPVREALHVLQGEGLVDMHPNRGAQVRGLDRARLVHIYEIRAALSSLAARRFAEEARPFEIRALEAIQAQHDAALDADDPPEVRRTNLLFHDAINKLGNNTEALAISARYYDLSASIRSAIGYTSQYPDRVRREHHTLLDAVRRHDGPAAAEIGFQHVRATLDDLMLQLDRTKTLSVPIGKRAASKK